MLTEIIDRNWNDGLSVLDLVAEFRFGFKTITSNVLATSGACLAVVHAVAFKQNSRPCLNNLPTSHHCGLLAMEERPALNYQID